MKRSEILRIIQNHEGEFRREYGVKSLSLFGSVARDEATPTSDVDILVEFDRPTGLFGLYRLQDRLENLLGCRIDLGTPNSLKSRLRARVMQDILHVV